jgi:phage terminase large subunit-like protein
MYETVRAYSRATVVVDPWQAAHLMQNLRNRRVRIQEFPFSAQSVGRLAITLHRLLRDHQVALPDDPELIDELANVKLVETAPSSYRIDHDSSAHDDRVISLALAAHRLVTTSGKPKIDSKKLAAAMAETSAALWKPSGGLVGY